MKNQTVFRDPRKGTIPAPSSFALTGPSASACVTRDGSKCLVTKGGWGDFDPVACHIVPLFWNRSGVDIMHTRDHMRKAFGVFLSRDRREELENLLLNEQGCSNHAWNMISLARQLRMEWSMARWGFKYIGTAPLPSEGKWKVTIQFHWMLEDPNRHVSPNNAVDWNKNHLDELQHPSSATAINVKTCRSVATGDTFTVTFTTAEEAHNFKLMIKLQWAMVRIAALSGASRDLVDLKYRDECGPAAASVASTSGSQDQSSEEGESGSVSGDEDEAAGLVMGFD